MPIDPKLTEGLIDWQNQFDEQHNPPGYPFTGDCWATVIAWQANTVHKDDPNWKKLFARDVRDLAGKTNGPEAGSLEDGYRVLQDKLGIRLRLGHSAIKTSRWVEMLVNPRRYWHMCTDFRQWPVDRRCQPDFTGRHGLAIPGGRLHQGDAGGQRLVIGNPLCREYESMAISHVIECAEVYAQDHGYPKGFVVVDCVVTPAAADDDQDDHDAILEQIAGHAQQIEQLATGLDQITGLAQQIEQLAGGV